MRRGVLPVAVKVVAGAVAQSEEAQLEFLREVAYLRSLLCPNIVQFQVLHLRQPMPSILSSLEGPAHFLLPSRCPSFARRCDAQCFASVSVCGLAPSTAG